MNEVQDRSNQKTQTAATEKKSGRGRRMKGDASPSVASATLAIPTSIINGEKTMQSHTSAAEVLNAATQGKFVLFAIARSEQVDMGPVMRGFIEIKDGEGRVPVKVNVAAWLKIGRNTGVQYLSLKVGNNSPQDPGEYSVGPFYGRLFRQVEGSRTRYFGFVEHAEKTGEDENGQGMYERHWQIRVTAKPAVSNDQKTRYISGSVMPSQLQTPETVEENGLPF